MVILPPVLWPKKHYFRYFSRLPWREICMKMMFLSILSCCRKAETAPGHEKVTEAIFFRECQCTTLPRSHT